MDLMLRYYPVATVSGWPARAGTARAFDRSFFDEAVPAGQAERGFAGANVYEFGRGVPPRAPAAGGARPRTWR